MTPVDLIALLGVPATFVPAALAVRLAAQAERDRHRHCYELGFPRTLTEEHVAAFIATLSGLATPRLALLGRDTAVLEVVASSQRVRFFMRLPSASRTYFIAQLRTIVSGIEVNEVEESLPDPVTIAQELRRIGPDLPLAIPNAAATAATIEAAASGTGRGQVAVWQWVIAGGSPQRPLRSWAEAIRAVVKPAEMNDSTSKRMLITASLRVAAGGGRERAPERLARLRRAASSVSVVGGRLVPSALPQSMALRRVRRGSSPVVTGATPVAASELVALLGWPIAAPSVNGVTLGSSPQIPPPFETARSGRVLGDTTAEPVRPVAIRPRATRLHALFVGPTGSGKSALATNLALQDAEAGRGVTVIDPKGSLVREIARRLPESALDRVLWLDPTDETRPVPLPLLTPDSADRSELAADTLIGLLRHRFSDLGPRSSDILTSSLYTLARVPGATLMDLFRLWSDTGYRQAAVGKVSGDPALRSFWASFEAASPSERSYWLQAPSNKIRPFLQRSAVRNVIAAPRSTFSFAETLETDRIVLVSLPSGAIGAEAASLIGQVVLARLWAAVQARRSRRSYSVIVDEAHRFLDQPTDLGDVLAMSREYGVGYALLVQSMFQLPERLRDVASGSARTKVAFQAKGRDANRLAAEFGPRVTPDMIAGLGEFEAIAAIADGGAVSEPFTMRTRPLADPVPGRLKAVREASRARYGLPREEIEASFAAPEPSPQAPPPDGGLGPVGRRPRS